MGTGQTNFDQPIHFRCHANNGRKKKNGFEAMFIRAQSVERRDSAGGAQRQPHYGRAARLRQHLRYLPYTYKKHRCKLVKAVY